MKALEKIHMSGDFWKDTLDYFLVKDPKLARFYLLPKIHKQLHDVPGGPLISNCSYYTKNISSFLDYYLEPLAQKVKSYIKDTNNFLSKLKSLWKLQQGAILCNSISGIVVHGRCYISHCFYFLLFFTFWLFVGWYSYCLYYSFSLFVLFFY